VGQKHCIVDMYINELSSLVLHALNEGISPSASLTTVLHNCIQILVLFNDLAHIALDQLASAP